MLPVAADFPASHFPGKAGALQAAGRAPCAVPAGGRELEGGSAAPRGGSSSPAAGCPPPQTAAGAAPALAQRARAARCDSACQGQPAHLGASAARGKQRNDDRDGQRLRLPSRQGSGLLPEPRDRAAALVPRSGARPASSTHAAQQHPRVQPAPSTLHGPSCGLGPGSPAAACKSCTLMGSGPFRESWSCQSLCPVRSFRVKLFVLQHLLLPPPLRS